jgi:glutamyl-tRNA synthetase
MPASSADSVVTRFAPSPTGYLHIGGARTALFNYLYAKHTGGRFLLRIEDTDRARSTDAAVEAIFEGLDWLGLKSDGEVTFQFARAPRHVEVVEALLDRGHAYRCYMTQDELEAARAEARAAGHALRSPWRRRQPAQGANDAPHVIRFAGPEDGETVIDDLVQGRVVFKNRDLDDLVLLRTDGAPTYNLAVVADDHDMGITHVIRGDDHLNNAARQALIYQAMDWPLPVFAHIPLIHGPDGAKLSKRHGAQAVGDFADLGYLPEALRNYLARLGWSHGDDELFSDAQAQAWFDIRDVNKGAARLDWDKLNHVNAQYLKQADDDRLTELVAQAIARRAQPLPLAAVERLRAAMPVVKSRGKTLLELANQAAFLFLARPLTFSDKAASQLTAEAIDRLARLRLNLEPISWTAPDLEAEIQSFAVSEGVGLGKIGPVLRAALTGGLPSPDLGATLELLGRQESLGRIDDALSRRQ